MSTQKDIVRNICSKYVYGDLVMNDVINVFGQFKDLRPSLDKYVFNDGSCKKLVKLDGTIPVNYKGQVYNIPICIWIMEMHPYEKPIVYVNPTSTMNIRQGKNVDANGKINLHYLENWTYPQSDLLGLLQILVIVFSEEPPVYQPTKPSYLNDRRYQAVETCDLCQRVGGNWKCVQCDEQYCDHCKLAHERSKASNTHSIYPRCQEETEVKCYNF